MGFFFDDDDEAPAPSITPYTPSAVTPNFPSVNFARIFDEVSGQEVSFVRGVDGEQYLEMKSKYEKAKSDLDRARAGEFSYSPNIQRLEQNLEDSRQGLESARNEQERNTGLRTGEIRLSFKDLSGKPKLDAPIEYDNVNTDLPPIRNLSEFNMLYAAKVASLTGALRTLGNTIETVSNLDPSLIQANRPLIDSFRQANQRSLNRNFDIRKSGLDLELSKRGLSDSSSAIGALVNLQRERNDAQVLNNFKEAELAQGLKQNTIQNYLSLGNQMVNEANIELGTYARESGNQLLARSQDQEQERLRQQQAANQIQLNLSKNQQRIDTELARRQLGLAEQSNRNLPQLINSLTGTANQQALAGYGLEADANLGVQKNQLLKSSLDLEKYKIDQANQSNFFGELGATVLGAAGATIGGSVGGYAGNYFGEKLFGVENKPEVKK